MATIFEDGTIIPFSKKPEKIFIKYGFRGMKKREIKIFSNSYLLTSFEPCKFSDMQELAKKQFSGSVNNDKR